MMLHHLKYDSRIKISCLAIIFFFLFFNNLFSKNPPPYVWEDALSQYGIEQNENICNDLDVFIWYNYNCYDEDVFFVAIVSGGTPPYSYQWSTGSTDDITIGHPNDQIEVIVMDAAGCDAFGNVFLYQPESDFGSIDYISVPESAAGANDASLTVEVFSYLGNQITDLQNYSITWSTGATTQTISNLTPGPYYVTVTDGTCQEFGSPIAEFTPDNCPLEISSATGSRATCLDYCDGDINISLLNGNPPYSFSWNNPEFDEDGVLTNDVSWSVFCPGKNHVTITDATNCSAYAYNIHIGYYSPSGENTFTGYGNDDLWTTPANWSAYHAPRPCEHAIIPAGFYVSLLDGEIGTCLTLHVELNGEFYSEPGAELIVFYP